MNNASGSCCCVCMATLTQIPWCSGRLRSANYPDCPSTEYALSGYLVCFNRSTSYFQYIFRYLEMFNSCRLCILFFTGFLFSYKNIIFYQLFQKTNSIIIKLFRYGEELFIIIQKWSQNGTLKYSFGNAQINAFLCDNLNCFFIVCSQFQIFIYRMVQFFHVLLRYFELVEFMVLHETKCF